MGVGGVGVFNPNPQASLDINPIDLSTADVTDVSANETTDFGSYNLSSGSFNYKVTAYRTEDGIKIYSTDTY